MPILGWIWDKISDFTVEIMLGIIEFMPKNVSKSWK